VPRVRLGVAIDTHPGFEGQAVLEFEDRIVGNEHALVVSREVEREVPGGQTDAPENRVADRQAAMASPETRAIIQEAQRCAVERALRTSRAQQPSRGVGRPGIAWSGCDSSVVERAGRCGRARRHPPAAGTVDAGGRAGLRRWPGGRGLGCALGARSAPRCPRPWGVSSGAGGDVGGGAREQKRRC